MISHTAHTGFNFWDIWDTVLNMVDWIQFQVFILSNSKKIPQLRNIVNVSIALARPLLVKGEPGTGKTLLSHAIAESLGKRLIKWNVKSTMEAIDGCYMYDTVQR